MPRQLPSLNGLRAFEAAGRLGSFKAAAQELNVTQTAVSHMVRLLEQRLGYELFRRKPNRLELTVQGRTFLFGLTDVFDSIAAAGTPPLRPVLSRCGSSEHLKVSWYSKSVGHYGVEMARGFRPNREPFSS